MGALKCLWIAVTLVGLSALASGLQSEADLLSSMRTLQLPSIDAQDFYSAHSGLNYRFTSDLESPKSKRSTRAVKFEDDSPTLGNTKAAEAISASFGLGPHGLSASVSSANSDTNPQGDTKFYPGAGGYNPGYYPPPYGGPGINAGFYPGGGYPVGGGGFGGSTSAAAAASSSGGIGGPGIGGHGGPFLGQGGPISHSSAAASAGNSVGGGYYPNGGGYYPGGGAGYYPPGGYYGAGNYPGNYNYGGYPGGYPGNYGNYYRPTTSGGLYGGPGYYPPPGGPGFYGPGYGGFRKGEEGSSSASDNTKGPLDKNLPPISGQRPSGGKPSSGSISFADN